MSKRKSDIINLYKKHLSKYKVAYYKKVGLDLVMGRRENIYFYDLDGKRYINCHCNGGVFNLGHKNPTVVKAIQDSLNDYDIGNHHLISEPRAELAKRLIESFNNGKTKSKLSGVIFGSSGGEVADLAIKLARGYTGRQKIISISGGYHGHTGLAAAAGDKKYRSPFGIELPDFVQVPFDDLEAMKREIPGAAAVILETVPATLGMTIFSKDFLKQVRQECDRNKVALIFDEVQTGLGRTGKMWGFHHYDVEPDIVITGKGLSGGIYPISAVCYRDNFSSVFKKDPFIHISTFGGAEVGCSAALAVLDTVSEPGFLEQVEESGQFLENSWLALRSKYDVIDEVRRLGLFMGVKLKTKEDCIVLVRTLIDNGIFVVFANNDKRVLQFLPPLIVNKEQLVEIMQIVAKSLNDMKRIKYKILKQVIKRLL
ncbi:MAG: aspartate aminotransferase family protein [Leptonema sp. (in: Bacteria)]|nr:aspartate aminotransferase family protein [Leptonema sp. (in: bacteria)]